MQTHLSHSGCPESGVGKGSPPEEGDRLERHSEWRKADGASERPPSVGPQGAGQCPGSTTHLSLAAKSIDIKSGAVPSRPSHRACQQGTSSDSKTWLPLGSSWHKMPE